MNYNQRYVNYQTPNNAGYGYQNNGYPQPGGQQQHGYPQQQPQRPQVTQTYGQHQQYGHYPPQNYGPQYQQPSPGYPHPQASPPQHYVPQPMVVIPQRSPVQTNSPATPHAPPPGNFHPQHQNYYNNSPQQLHQPPPQPSPQWQNHNRVQQRPPPRPPSQPQYHQSPPQQFAPSPQPQPPQQQASYTRPPPHPQPPRQPQVLQRPPPPKPVAMVEIPMQSPRYPQKPSQRAPQQDVPPTSSLTSLGSSPAPPSSIPAIKKLPTPQAPPVDYQQLLLLMAEDYINAAHGMGSLVAFYRRQEDLEEYYRLLATGLSCVEASLTQFRLQPRPQAELTLQYCNLVYQETENYDVVDTWLAKAIPIADRNRMLDLKYSMQHLSARALFKTKPKVALKSLDGAIKDCQAYKHVPWVYALRFLRVTFSLEMGVTQHELASATQNLRAISELASDEGDAAVSLICATYEALVQLRSMSGSSVEEAQRAIAAARSLQFDPLAKSLKQLWVLLDCIELMCYVITGNLEMAGQKSQQLAVSMDDAKKSASKDDNGTLLIPLAGQPESLTDNTAGIFKRIDGRDHLVFSWLRNRDLWTLCFLLNAVAAQAKNSQNEKTEAYLMQGLKIMKENFSESSLEKGEVVPATSSLNEAAKRLDWWFNLRWFFHIYMATSMVSRGEWAKARQCLDKAQDDCPRVSSINSAGSRAKWETYLHGTILQGTGQTPEALQVFQSPMLQLPIANSNHVYDFETDLSILAVLNSILISLDPANPDHNSATFMHDLLSPLIPTHPNKALRASHDLLKSILNPNDKLIDKKKHLTNCISAARAVQNNLLISIALSLMCTMLFKDAVGEQAQKSVKSARAMAERSGLRLWKGVTSGMVGATAGRHGMVDEEQKAMADVDKYVGGLPQGVRQRFAVDSIEDVMDEG